MIEVRYALSQFGKAMIWYVLEVYSLYFITEILGLPPILTGLSFFAIMTIDALANVLIGISIDRWLTWRAVNCMLMFAIPVLAVLFASSFWLVRLPGLAICIFVLFQLTRLAFACVDVPHNSVLLDLAIRGFPPDRLAVVRQVMNLAAILAVTLLDVWFASTHLPGTSVAWLATSIALLGAAMLSVFPRVDASFSHRQSYMHLELGYILRPGVSIVLMLMLGSYALNTLLVHSLPYIANRFAGRTDQTGKLLSSLLICKLASTPLIWFAFRLWKATGTGFAIMLVFGISGIALLTGYITDPSSISLLSSVAFADNGMTIVAWALIMRAYADGSSVQGASATLMAVFTSMGRLGSGVSGLILTILIATPAIDLSAGLGGIMACGSVIVIGLIAAVYVQLKPRPDRHA